MAGLIVKALELGSERAELVKGFDRPLIGGANLPYSPKDLAGVVTILRQQGTSSYLALESVSNGGAQFIADEVGIEKVESMDVAGEKEERKYLRNLTRPFDLISIDARSFSLSAEEIWKYIEGGKEEKEAKFGAGAPRDYGIPKLSAKACILVNMADEQGKALYFRLRARYTRVYQSIFAGMVKV